MPNSENGKTAAIAAASMTVVFALILAVATLFEKKVPKQCTPCESGWINVPDKFGHKRVQRYKYKKKEKQCYVLTSEHIWYKLDKVHCIAFPKT